MTPAPIALLTDFGLNDTYVGAMKAVILAIAPGAVIVDLTHEVPPQAIEEGTFLLATVVPFLPSGAICVAVVDPGVGTERAAIALRTERLTFVGPDNGLLSASLHDEERPRAASPGLATPVAIPSHVEAVRLTNSLYFRQPVSNTFHGRDIFAPVAAHLSTGRPLDDFGDRTDTMLAFPAWHATRTPEGLRRGRVIHIDHYGNLVSDVPGADLPGAHIRVQIAGREFVGPQRTFHDGPEFSVYIGSAGFLEIARRDGSAAGALGVRTGAEILVLPEAHIAEESSGT